MRKYYYLFILVLLIQACGQFANEEGTAEPPSCDCPMLNDFIRTSSELSDINGNTNKSDAMQGTNFIAEVSYDSTSKGVKIVVPIPKKGEKSYEEYHYDGSQVEFEKSIFLVRWCALWTQYIDLTSCRILASNMEHYDEKRKELFEKYDGMLSPKKSDAATESTKKSAKENTRSKGKEPGIQNNKNCRDTLIKSSSFGMKGFEYIKLNGVVVPPLGDEKVSFCYEKGDLLEVKGRQKEVIRIQL